jgi:uncharacterized repeat protein (TIGR01451 family)
VQGAISGSVWFDNGGGAPGASTGAGAANRKREANEPGLSAWIVEAVFPPGDAKAGQIATTLAGLPATATTDATGAYQLPGLSPGNYQLRFRAPPGATAAGAMYGGPVNGEQGNPQPNSLANPVARTLDISVPSGGGLVQQSLPLDPSGVVYDSITRQPIIGAIVVLLGPNGQPVPASDLLPNQQNQTVVPSGPAAGNYRFDLLPTAPAGIYTIQVTPPAGYNAPSTILPAAALLAYQAGPAPYTVVPTSFAPQAGESTVYHLQVTINPPLGGADIVHNHIPLDPQAPPQLAIDKRANVTTAEVGDLVRYTIRVRNLSNTLAVNGLSVVDQLPVGFKYVAKTTRLNNQLGSPATVAPEPSGAPGPQLSFNLGKLSASQTAEFSYYVKLGVGATAGDGINRAYAQAGPIRSVTAQAKVNVNGGVFRTEACLVGKIFSDCGNSVGQGNGNGIQDMGELGIPGVRLYLQDGTSLVSDAEGKYSFCGLKPRTHVLKVDDTTLPAGTRLGVTSNRNGGDPGSLFLDLKNGELDQADFRNMSCSKTVSDEVQRRREELRKTKQDVNAPAVTGDGPTGPGLGLRPEVVKKGAQP